MFHSHMTCCFVCGTRFHEERICSQCGNNLTTQSGQAPRVQIIPGFTNVVIDSAVGAHVTIEVGDSTDLIIIIAGDPVMTIRLDIAPSDKRVRIYDQSGSHGASPATTFFDKIPSSTAPMAAVYIRIYMPK